MIERRLSGLRQGSLVVMEDGELRRFGRPGGMEATIEIHDPRFYRRLLMRGAVGVAEAWMDGWWSCDDLVVLLRIFVNDLSTSDRMERGSSALARLIRRVRHRLRRNTRTGSRRNIRDHYDLGNDFFSLWLDRTMTYSCGIYPDEDSSLEEASVAKLDHICRRLGLRPGHRVLEIGTGWGSFAIHAAVWYGCHVTTTTISREQHELASARVAELELQDQITLLHTDYRELEGRFDRIVSIEMIEAVGHDHHPAFFKTCQELLTPDGEMLIQAITIADQRYERAARSVDFIQRYVFPGSCLLSPTRMCEVATRNTDLRLVGLEDITPHYARTLADWRRRFLARLDEVRAQGYPQRFIKMWDFYLAYCEAGFAERHIGDVQVVFARPLSRRSQQLTDVPAQVTESEE